MSSSTVPVLFEMFRGNDVAFNVKVRNKETGAPVDITGWFFRATMKRGPTDDENDETAPVKVDYGPLSGVDAEAGVLPILLPKEQTRNLGPGLYFIDVEQEVLGFVTTVIYGRVRVNGDITRRSAA